MSFITDPLPPSLIQAEKKQRRELAELLLHLVRTGKLPSSEQDARPEDNWTPPPAEADLTLHRDLYTLSCGSGYERQRRWTDDEQINPPLAGPNGPTPVSGRNGGGTQLAKHS